MTTFGPWIVWGKAERPEGLADDDRVEVVCHDENGNLHPVLRARGAAAHAWVRIVTLAYRVEVQDVTYVVYGKLGGSFHKLAFAEGTHKITYVMRGDDVVSCKMEKLDV
jgi:hypothetical protein